MTAISDTRQREASTRAAGELVALQQQIMLARAVLDGLQHDLEDATGQLSDSTAARLVEVNERLVVSTLLAQTEAQASAQALEHASRAAGLDALTQLPNRALLLDHFALAIANARRHDTGAALLFVDLNNFKQINDSLGHAVGDEMIQVAAQRLASSVREVDTVSRHGGDEFLILLAEVSQGADAALVADQIISALAAPHTVNGHVLRLTASIGISVYPEDGDDADTLIQRADAAMYRAKRQGLGGFVFHRQMVSDPDGPESDGLEPSPPESLRRRLSDRKDAATGQDHRLCQMQEANEQLIRAALGAQVLQAAAEQAQRRQADFLAVLVHELRNPLAPISTAAALLGHPDADKTLLPQLQAIIERQVGHMTRLVGDLLDVSRAATGKLRLQRQAVDMALVIDQAVDACRPAMGTRLQTFDVDLPARALMVNGDPVRMTQVLTNLLDNASKYTPTRGRIGLSVAVHDGAMVMTVSDSGIGISADALSGVFEPFVQDPRAIGFNGAGLGIGLTVVRELVQAHGGDVVATSAGIGQGSQFVVTLPLLPGGSVTRVAAAG